MSPQKAACISMLRTYLNSPEITLKDIESLVLERDDVSHVTITKSWDMERMQDEYDSDSRYAEMEDSVLNISDAYEVDE